MIRGDDKDEFIETESMNLNTSLIASFFCVLTACGSACAVPADIDPSLLGCWRGVNIRQHASDGSFRDQAGYGRLEYGSSTIVTGYDSQPTRYRYEIQRKGVYLATIIEHPARPDLIGSTREYEYRVEGDELFITTYPQTSKPTPPTAAVKVESISKRVGKTCATK